MERLHKQTHAGGSRANRTGNVIQICEFFKGGNVKKILIFLFLFSLIGCRGQYFVKSDPTFQSVDKTLYSIRLIPSGNNGYGYTAFDLSIENKTDSDIELVWDKTYYLSGGKTSGGFMFEGVVYKDRNNSKPSDIVFPKESLQKTIWPNILVAFYRQWYNQQMPDGENGAYVTLKINDKEIREKMTVNLSTGYESRK